MASNRTPDKTIRISEITELKFGQVSAVFKKNRIPEYEVLAIESRDRKILLHYFRRYHFQQCIQIDHWT